MKNDVGGGSNSQCIIFLSLSPASSFGFSLSFKYYIYQIYPIYHNIICILVVILIANFDKF